MPWPLYLPQIARWSKNLASLGEFGTLVDNHAGLTTLDSNCPHAIFSVAASKIGS